MASQPPSPAQDPFVWGKGGVRLTPADIELRKRLAMQQMQQGADFSPVGHWTQGLARAAQGLLGGFEMADARKATERNAAANDAIMAALLPQEGSAPAGDDVVLRALMDPAASDQVREFAKLEYGRRNPKPTEPPEVVQLARIANDPLRPDWERKAAADRITAINDPQAIIPLPGGRGTFIGRQSQIPSAFQGGGDPSGAPQTTAPPAEAVEELRRDPSGAAEFDEVFGAGAAARVLGGGASNGTGGFPDPMKAPGHMTSGRRTPAGNRAVGGDARSHHLTGDAADYAGTTLDALRQYFGPAARLLDEGDHIHATLPGYGRVPYFGRRGTQGRR